MDSNEQTVFGHGGDTVWFHSLSMMLPESRLGVFIAYNTDSGSAARDQFSVSFLDHYFPQPLPKEPPAAAAASSLQRFTGTYAPSRASLHDATKMMRLLGAATMKVDADGYLAMTRRGASTRWRQIAPLVFAEVDGPKRLYFKENERGDVAQACASPLCVVAALKQPWWNGRAFQYTWAGVSLAVLLLGLIAFPIAAVVQRGKARPPASKIARATAWLACLLTLSAAGLFAAKAEPSEIVFGIPDALAYALGLWVVAAALSAVLVGLTIRAWESGWWRWTGRVSFTLVTASLVAAMFWLHHWNLLGWRY